MATGPDADVNGIQRVSKTPGLQSSSRTLRNSCESMGTVPLEGHSKAAAAAAAESRLLPEKGRIPDSGSGPYEPPRTRRSLPPRTPCTGRDAGASGPAAAAGAAPGGGAREGAARARSSHAAAETEAAIKKHLATVTSRSLGRTAVTSLTRRLDVLEGRCAALLEERHADRKRIACLERALEKSRKAAEPDAAAAARGAGARAPDAPAAPRPPVAAPGEALGSDISFPHVPTVDLTALPSQEAAPPAMPAPPALPEPREPSIPKPAPRGGDDGQVAMCTGGAFMGIESPPCEMGQLRGFFPPADTAGVVQISGVGDGDSSQVCQPTVCPHRLGDGHNDSVQKALSKTFLIAARMSYYLMAEVALPTVGAATSAMAAGFQRLRKSTRAVQSDPIVHKGGLHVLVEDAFVAEADVHEPQYELKPAPSTGKDVVVHENIARAANPSCRIVDALGASEPLEELQPAPRAIKEVLVLDDASKRDTTGEVACTNAVEMLNQFQHSLEPVPGTEKAVLCEPQSASQVVLAPGCPRHPRYLATPVDSPSRHLVATPKLLACFVALAVWHLQRKHPLAWVQVLLATFSTSLKSARGTLDETNLALLGKVALLAVSSGRYGDGRVCAAGGLRLPPLPSWAAAAAGVLWPSMLCR